MKKKFLPQNLYKKIVGLTPIFCIDLVVKKKNFFLLAKRKEKPAKNKWWFPGGRLFLGEKINTAIKKEP